MVFGWITGGLDQRLKDQFVRTLVTKGMGFESFGEVCDSVKQAIVYDALVFEGNDLVSTVVAFLVYLILLCTNKGAFVDIGMNLDVRIIAKLKGVLSGVSIKEGHRSKLWQQMP